MNWPSDKSHIAIFNFVKAIYGHRSDQPGVARVLAKVQLAGIEKIYIRRLSDVNRKLPSPTGDTLGAWFYNGNELTSAPLDYKIEYYDAISSPTPMLGFAIDPDAGDIAIYYHCGVRASRTLICKPAEKYAYVHLEQSSARMLIS